MTGLEIREWDWERMVAPLGGELNGYLLVADRMSHPIMISSGRPDKNGQTIFEGDIVNCLPLEKRGTVKWCEHRCGLIIETEDFQTMLFSDYVDEELEILGNFYENPEKL